MAFVVKAEVRDPQAETFFFTAQKTMYGGKLIKAGDTIFIFASERRPLGSGGGVPRGRLLIVSPTAAPSSSAAL